MHSSHDILEYLLLQSLMIRNDEIENILFYNVLCMFSIHSFLMHPTGTKWAYGHMGAFRKAEGLKGK